MLKNRGQQELEQTDVTEGNCGCYAVQRNCWRRLTKIVIEDGGVRELVTAIARFTAATTDQALIEKRVMSVKM